MAEIRVDDDILLRSPTMADAEDIFALVDSNREHLGCWLPWIEAMRSLEDERQWIEGYMKEQAEGTSLAFLIVYQGAIVGVIATESIDLLRKTCESGYFLADSLQGRGIVTRACRGLLSYIFDNLGMNRVQVRIMPHNVRSIAIPQRLGFVYEGIQRQAQLLNGQFYDFAVYSMLASEWANAKAPGGSLAPTSS